MTARLRSELLPWTLTIIYHQWQNGGDVSPPVVVDMSRFYLAYVKDWEIPGLSSLQFVPLLFGVFSPSLLSPLQKRALPAIIPILDLNCPLAHETRGSKQKDA